MFQIFAIRALTAFVTIVAKANYSTSNLTPKVLLGVLLTLAPAGAQILPICATAPSDTMTAGPGPYGFYYDDRISSGTNYTTAECTGYYTVDIIVPGTYRLPDGWNLLYISGGFANSQSELTQNSCQFASESLQIYKRSSLGGSWKLVSSRNVTGTWFPGGQDDPHAFCALGYPLQVTASGSNVGYDVYRVLVLPKLLGVPVQAEVWWNWSF